ncbi:MAG: GNAT family N-acetyltransferase [Cereibacter changlensis]
MTPVTRLLTSPGEITGLAGQWNALAGSLGAMAIFWDAEATLANLMTRTERRARPHVLTVFDDGAMIAAAPLVWTPGWTGLGVLHWADSGTPLYTGLLCRPDREAQVFPLLAEGLLGRPGLRKVKVNYVPDDSALARFCHALGARPGDPAPTPCIDLSAGPVIDRLSPKRRKALRAYRRKLDRMGPVAFRTDRSPEGLAELVAWIFEFKRRKLTSQEGADWIQRPQTEGYFRDLAMRKAAQGHVLGHCLCVGDRTAAASLTFLCGDTAFYSKIAYDPQFAATSPGWQELVGLSDHLGSEGVRTLNLMMGPGFVKEQLATGAGAVRNWRLAVNPVAQGLERFLIRSESPVSDRSTSAP